jgi:hypothetical protein
MPGMATHRRSLRCRRPGKRSHLQAHAARPPTRLASSGQLMAQGGSLLLPQLAAVPLIHRVVATALIWASLLLVTVATGR